MLLGELKVGDRFEFLRKENTLKGIFTLTEKNGLCRFTDGTGGGMASKFSEVIKKS